MDARSGLAYAHRVHRRRSSIDKASKANISDTQTATFEFDDLRVVWTHRMWGDAPDPKYPWGATFYGDKAHS